MDILAVTAEVFPLIKTGGLADVTGSLPKALKKFGVRVKTLIPGYRAVMRALPSARLVKTYDDLFGVQARILAAQAAGLDLLILDAPEFFDRPGGPYLNEYGKEHHDNWKRFAAFSKAASEVGGSGVKEWKPCLIHAHDWHSALTLAYLKYGEHFEVPRVLTVHNLAFQGQFPACHFPRLGLPAQSYSEALEYYGELGYLKAGLAAADKITVVSPTYAREIMSPEGGMGLDGVMNARHDDVIGIVNGIDLEVWDPSCDPHLNYPFSARTPLRRLGNRYDLLDRFGLPHRHGPVFASVNRLTWQKGMDLLADVADEFFWKDGMLVVHGQGDPHIEGKFLEAAERYPQHVSVKIGYDESLAHLIHAGADAMLVPSRFEPCGLTQLYALRYGCIPIVARTGGLSETIIDANDAAVHAQAATGIQFLPIDHQGLRHALRRAVKLYRRHRTWERLRRQAMKTDCSWERSAEQYCEIYSRLLNENAELRQTG